MERINYLKDTVFGTTAINKAARIGAIALLAASACTSKEVVPTEAKLSTATPVPTITIDNSESISLANTAINVISAQATTISQLQETIAAPTQPMTGGQENPVRSQMEITATSTPEPTNTLLPTQTAINEIVQTNQAVVGIQSTATPEFVARDLSLNWTGEFAFNNFVGVDDQTFNLMEHVNLELINELENIHQGFFDRNTMLRSNSTLSSLVNPFSKGVSRDPVQEPGLGQTESDILSYENIQDIIQDIDTMKGSEIFHINENDLRTVGIYGSANDRDAILAIHATGRAVEEGFINGDQTIQQIWQDPSKVAIIRAIEVQMLNETQHQGLGNSAEENERLKNANEDDASVHIPQSLRTDSQWISRDVFRSSADDRQEQMQETRCVVHNSEEEETFNHANSEHEMLLYVTAYDLGTKIIDTDAFTFRSYVGDVENQIGSTVGEEMRPNCTEGQSQSITRPTQPQPGNTQVFYPTVTPYQETQVFQTPTLPIPSETPIRVTENPTITPQNPEPTIVPGTLPAGTPTPVATYPNTPMPTIEVPPTQPAPEIPSSTPAI